MAAGIASTLAKSPLDIRCYQSGSSGHINSDTNFMTSGGSFAVPAQCGTWNDDRICGEKRGVEPGRSISQDEFDVLDLKDSAALDGFSNGRALSHADFACTFGDDGGRLPPINPVEMSIELGGTITLSVYVQQFYMHDGNGHVPSTGADNLDGEGRYYFTE